MQNFESDLAKKALHSDNYVEATMTVQVADYINTPMATYCNAFHCCHGCFLVATGHRNLSSKLVDNYCKHCSPFLR